MAQGTRAVPQAVQQVSQSLRLIIGAVASAAGFIQCRFLYQGSSVPQCADKLRAVRGLPGRKVLLEPPGLQHCAVCQGVVCKDVGHFELHKLPGAV